MDLSEHDTDRIANKVCSRIHISCSCGLSQDDRHEMPHLVGMIKDEGEGNMSRGIEHIRNVIQSDKRARKIGQIIGKSAIVSFVTALTAAGAAALWRWIAK